MAKLKNEHPEVDFKDLLDITKKLSLQRAADLRRCYQQCEARFLKDGKRWLVIPYYEHGTLVFAKYRTLPPSERGSVAALAAMFRSTTLMS